MIAPLLLVASIVLNQPGPVYGDTVTFTMTFPREAASNARQNQFPNQPSVQVNCYQNGVQVAREGVDTIQSTKERLGGGWYTAQSGPVNFSERQEFTWDPALGPADCLAIMYSTEVKRGVLQQTIWATVGFTVDV